MSEDFAKIVRTSDGKQVLFYIEPDGDTYVLHQVLNIEGGQADAKLVFDNTEGDVERNWAAANDALQLCDEARADQLRKTVSELFEG